jgi:hypothetical protein
MPENNRQIVAKAINALAEEVRPQLMQVIFDLIEDEKITEVLFGLGLISDEDQGEILAEGLFTGFSQAMDSAFSFNEDDEDSDDEDEEIEVDINFPCCGDNKNKKNK